MKRTKYREIEEQVKRHHRNNKTNPECRTFCKTTGLVSSKSQFHAEKKTGLFWIKKKRGARRTQQQSNVWSFTGSIPDEGVAIPRVGRTWVLHPFYRRGH